MANEVQKAYLKYRVRDFAIQLKPEEYDKVKDALKKYNISLADLLRVTARYYNKKRETK